MSLSTSLRGDRYAGHAAQEHLIATASEEIAEARRLQALDDHANATGLLDLAACRLALVTETNRNQRNGRSK